MLLRPVFAQHVGASTEQLMSTWYGCTA